MRKFLTLLAAGAMALSIAGPVSAAPVKNPHVGQWEIVCPGMDPFVVTAKGVPGWIDPAGPGTTPWLLRAAVWYEWQAGAPVGDPYVLLAPPGLEGTLVGPCMLHVFGGTPSADLRSDDTWFQVP